MSGTLKALETSVPGGSSIDLPVDIIGVLISILPTEEAVRLILTSKKFFKKDGWAHIKWLQLDVDYSRLLGYGTRGFGQRDDAASRTNMFIDTMVAKIPLLTGINSIVAVGDSAWRIPPVVAPKVAALLRSFAPQLEFCRILNLDASVRLEPLIETMDPQKLCELHLIKVSDLAKECFTTRSWPNLEVLWIDQIADKGRLAQIEFGRLRRLILQHYWTGDMIDASRIESYQTLLDKNPNLHLISCVTRHYSEDRFNCLHNCDRHNNPELTQNVLRGLIESNEHRNLTTVLRIECTPIWMAQYPVKLGESELYSEFYARNGELELKDLLVASILALEGWTEPATEAQLLWLEQKIVALFDQQRYRISSNGMFESTLALCALLSKLEGSTHKHVWRERLLDMIDDGAIADYYPCPRGMFSFRAVRDWMKGVIETEGPESSLSRAIVDLISKLAGCSKYDRPVGDLELTIASTLPADEAPWWFFRCICWLIASEDLAKDDLFAQFLLLAQSKRWRRVMISGGAKRLLRHIERDSTEMFEVDTILFRICENADCLIASGMPLTCYMKRNTFEPMASWVRAHRDAFHESSPESVQKVEERFAEVVWRFVFWSNQPALEPLVSAALAVVQPKGDIRELLLLEGTAFERKVNLSSYELDRVLAVRAIYHEAESINVKKINL